MDMRFILLLFPSFLAIIFPVQAWFGPMKDNVTGSSYYISEDVASEPDASKTCRLNGWILATVKSRSQQKTLEKLARQLPPSHHQDIWIGLRLYRIKGKKKQGYGVWSDGKPFNVSKKAKGYQNWHVTEPLTYLTTTQTNQPTCVRLWKRQGWRWDDYYCNYEQAPLSRYACESKEKEKYESSDLQRISEDFIANTEKVESSNSNLESLSNAVNELLTVDEALHEKNQSVSREVIASLDEFLGNYDANKDGNFHSDKSNVEINATAVSANESLFTGRKDDDDDERKNSIQIYISPELVKEAAARNKKTKNKTIQVNSVFYRNPSLFQINHDRYTKRFSEESNVTFESRYLNAPMFGEDPTITLLPVLISDVLSVDVKNVKMEELENPVCITNYHHHQDFTPPEISDMIAKVNPMCAFWDFSINEWSTKGCRILKPLEEHKFCGPMVVLQNRSQRVTCTCNHMTHFSMLLDTTYTYAPKYLTHITIFGCTVSIICLFASIVTILTFKQLRTKTAQQILLQLCITLLIMNVIFLTGIDKRHDKLFCTVIASLLHYFLLASWAFMFLEAVFLFLSLVMPMYNGGVRGKIVPVGGLLCYGIPGLIAGITVGVSRSDVYLSEKYCWLSMHILVPSLLVPVALILFGNIVIFICVIYTITFKSKMFRKRVNLIKIRQTLVRALCMIFILGIPWLFGFFMLLAQRPSTKEAFAVCFTILNTTQGVAIFFFFCARQEQVRKLWLVPLNQKVRRVVRKARSKRSIRRESHKSEKLVEDSTEKSHTDETRSKTATSERSVVTDPSSHATVETNTNSRN